MIDNEIVKALECCKLTNEQQESQCEDCPLWETSLMICQELLAFHALDLINRQKAEIERVKEAYAVYEETTGLKLARAEAIKEFAERLRKKITDYYENQDQEEDEGSAVCDYLSYLDCDIDDLVKEMTEEAK